MRAMIKQPVSGKVARVPVVMQMEALECGAASLAMVCAYYNKWISLEKVRSDCGVSRDGASAKNVVQAARGYGLQAEGYRYDRPEDLRKNGTFPCIIHWNFNHFVVLCGFRGNHAYINDPARGSLKVSLEEFDESFTGVCLFFSPEEDFVPEGKQKSMIGFARKRMQGAVGALVFMALVTLTAYLIGAIVPEFDKFFMDQVLTLKSVELLAPFLILLTVVTILAVVTEALRSIFTLRLSGKVGMAGSASFFWKALKLPVEFYTQRMTGDVLLRQNTNATIANTLIQTIAPLAMNIIMVIFYLCVMLNFSLLLTCIGLGSILINILMSQMIASRRLNLMRAAMRDEGRLRGTTLYGMQMIETIKASGAENGFFRKWAGYQASAHAMEMKAEVMSLRLGIIPQVVSQVAESMILVLGVWLCMRGQLSLGTVMLLQSYLTLLMNPAQTLIRASQKIQVMRSDMERVEDVMDYPDDPCYRDELEEEVADFDKLSGRIELNNITFGYSKLAEPLFRDFSLSTKPGGRIAIVGESGCGKSTLSKLISGLYRPWSGEVLFDGKTADEIPRSIFTASVAVVDQEITMFEDTIANNIKMWDDSIEDFEMILAAEDARIRQDIMERDGGFEHRLAEGGKDLSGGQRQRLEIARVLAQDPTILIMDEATSALDAKTEYELVEAVKSRGITCIIIAHRLSTIRNCDEIIVLDHGKVAERGTHEELFQKGGLYTSLITSD